PDRHAGPTGDRRASRCEGSALSQSGVTACMASTESDSPIEPWSVDPTLRFDRIHVIESLGTGFAGRSGRRLAEEIESLAAGGPVKVSYHPVDGRDLLWAVLRVIVSE